MNNAINLALFEFAFKIERLVREGWKLSEIDYGRPSWDIGPKLLIEKGERKEWCDNEQRIDELLREIENEIVVSRSVGAE